LTNGSYDVNIASVAAKKGNFHSRNKKEKKIKKVVDKMWKVW
jgi:hypothetical protein